MERRYEIIVFCNGSSAYCKPILDYIEKENKYFAHRIYSEHVLFDNSLYSVKFYDYLLTDGRTDDNTVIAEVNAATYIMKMKIGIPVTPRNALMQNDIELIYLAKYLDKLANCSSIVQEISASLNTALHENLF